MSSKEREIAGLILFATLSYLLSIIAGMLAVFLAVQGASLERTLAVLIASALMAVLGAHNNLLAIRLKKEGDE